MFYLLYDHHEINIVRKLTSSAFKQDLKTYNTITTSMINLSINYQN